MSLAFQNLKTELGTSDRLTFGKYNGSFLEDVIYNDPRYVLWLIARTDNRLNRAAQKALAEELMSKLDSLSAEVRTKKKIPMVEQYWDDDDTKIPF